MAPTLLFAASLLFAAQVPETSAPALDARVRGCLEARRAADGFPGVTCAWMLADGTRGAVAVGVADRATGVALEPTDRMLAGSVGKTYLAAVVLRRCAAGELELDAPIARVVGESDWLARLPNGPALTLRHLLMHRSGVPEHVFDPAFDAALRADPDRRFTPRELVEYVLDRAPLFAPDERFEYADTNFVVVGMVLEARTGKAWYTLLESEVTRPLELTATTPQVGREIDGLVQGHLAQPGILGIASDRMLGADGRLVVDPQFEYTGGGVVANAPDLARWAAVLYGGDFLAPEWRARMCDGRRTASRRVPGAYGLGACVWESAHGRVIGHGGFFPGYLTEIGYLPEHGLALAVQVNTDDGGTVGGSTRRLLEEIAGVCLEG